MKQFFKRASFSVTMSQTTKTSHRTRGNVSTSWTLGQKFLSDDQLHYSIPWILSGVTTCILVHQGLKVHLVGDKWLTSWHMTQFWLISLMDATQRQICYLLIYPFWVLILATWVYASFKITLYLITKYESTYLELWTLQLWVIINK